MRDDDPMTLRSAAENFGFTVLTLRAEADKGRLAIYKVGRQYYTTAADVREMVKLCHVAPKARAFTLIRNESSGSSGTGRASSALAAANETVLRLKNTSRNTSEKSTNLSRQVRR